MRPARRAELIRCAITIRVPPRRRNAVSTRAPVAGSRPEVASPRMTIRAGDRKTLAAQQGVPGAVHAGVSPDVNTAR
jgi:hypothetical protein